MTIYDDDISTKMMMIGNNPQRKEASDLLAKNYMRKEQYKITIITRKH